MIIDFLAEYYKNIDRHPVPSQVKPGHPQKRLPLYAPNKAEPIGLFTHRCVDRISTSSTAIVDLVPRLTHREEGIEPAF